eukprot:scaffold3882_cov110-Isochrysis_galbana.AAC.2
MQHEELDEELDEDIVEETPEGHQVACASSPVYSGGGAHSVSLTRPAGSCAHGASAKPHRQSHSYGERPETMVGAQQPPFSSRQAPVPARLRPKDRLPYSLGLAHLPASPVRQSRGEPAAVVGAPSTGIRPPPTRILSDESACTLEEVIALSPADTPRGDFAGGFARDARGGTPHAALVGSPRRNHTDVLDEGARLLDEWLTIQECSPFTRRSSGAPAPSPWAVGVAGVPELRHMAEAAGDSTADGDLDRYEEDFLEEDIDEEEMVYAFGQCSPAAGFASTPGTPSGRRTPSGGLEWLGHGLQARPEGASTKRRCDGHEALPGAAAVRERCDEASPLFRQLQRPGDGLPGRGSGGDACSSLMGRLQAHGQSSPANDRRPLSSSMGQRQASAQAEGEAISEGGWGVQVGVATGRGMRAHMEDYVRLCVLRVVGAELLYFAVFDGHNGQGAARTASRQLHRLLVQRLEWLAHAEVRGGALPAEGTDESSRDSALTAGSSPSHGSRPGSTIGRRGASSRAPAACFSGPNPPAAKWAVSAQSGGHAATHDGRPGTPSTPSSFTSGRAALHLSRAAIDRLLPEALYESFLLLDAWLKRHKRIAESRASSRQAAFRPGGLAAQSPVAAEGGDSRRAPAQNAQGGTTALVAVVHGGVLHIASAGDSRCVLARSGVACRLTTDHSPSLPAETERIEELGGLVIRGRVHGVLAVSRAMGDPELQPFVTPEPQVSLLRRRAGDGALILGSDGVWGVLPDAEACSLASEQPSAQAAAQALVDVSDARGGRDNASAIVIRWTVPEAKPGRAGEGVFRP